MGTTRPPMPLAVSATTLRGRSDADVDEGDDVVGPLVEQVRARARGPVSGGSGSPSSSSAVGLDLGQAGVAPDRARAPTGRA